MADVINVFFSNIFTYKFRTCSKFDYKNFFFHVLHLFIFRCVNDIFQIQRTHARQARKILLWDNHFLKISTTNFVDLNHKFSVPHQISTAIFRAKTTRSCGKTTKNRWALSKIHNKFCCHDPVSKPASNSIDSKMVSKKSWNKNSGGERQKLKSPPKRVFSRLQWQTLSTNFLLFRFFLEINRWNDTLKLLFVMMISVVILRRPPTKVMWPENHIFNSMSYSK